MSPVSVAENVARIRDRIAQSASRSGRLASEIELLAVSKTVEPERILQAYAAGVRLFGENYAQEAREKVGASLLALSGLRWRFIGHLQTNKVRDVVGKFECIQSVDTLRLAQEIGRRSQALGMVTDILLEVKLDSGAAKFGFDPTAVLEATETLSAWEGLRVCGLMGMAPYDPDPEAARGAFRLLRHVFDSLPEEARQTLSMGMTGDFEVAIEEGATQVRIGTALFGARR